MAWAKADYTRNICFRCEENRGEAVLRWNDTAQTGVANGETRTEEV